MSRVRTGTVVPAAKCGVVRMAKGGIEGMPKWMRTRQRKEEQLRELENELRNFK